MYARSNLQGIRPLAPHMNQPFLSAVVIAFNESQNIERCLKSLQAIADEILVVDSGSTDDTVAKSEALGARVLHHAFEGHIEQKNWAAEQALGRWLISLDADESLSAELALSLQAWKSKAPENFGYRLNRLTSYCGHWVRHGGWYPDQKLRLWQKGKAYWTGENPHDRLELIQDKPSGYLEGDLLHHSYHSVDDHIRQIEYFSDIAAVHYTGPFWLTSRGIRLFKRVFQWSKNALLRGGWRDGRTGLIIAKYSALATEKKYEKARRYRLSKRLLKAHGKSNVERVLVCRTDAIGDAVLTLPIASWIKSSNPDLKVDFLVRSYAAPVVSAAIDVDNVVVWGTDMPPDLSVYDAAIVAFPDVEVVRFLHNQGVAIVVGTSRRWPFQRWLTHRNRTSRKVSGQHEAWHGLELAKSMHPAPGWELPGLQLPASSNEMKHLGRLRPRPWSDECVSIEGASQWLIKGRKNIIVHPGSAGSANNWTVGHYLELTERLNSMGHRVLWTGTAFESKQLNLNGHSLPTGVIDTMGKMNLDQLLAMIGVADGLIASSTGPLHMAAASNTMCLGLYGPNAPEWPQRWHPLGPKAHWITAKRLTDEGALDIQVDEVLASMQDVFKA